VSVTEGLSAKVSGLNISNTVFDSGWHRVGRGAERSLRSWSMGHAQSASRWWPTI